MPAFRFLGVSILFGCLGTSSLGCEVKDHGLVTPLRPQPAATDAGRPPSNIDPPAQEPAPPPDAAPAPTDVAPAPPIDPLPPPPPPPPVAMDAAVEAPPPDAAATIATNCAALPGMPSSVRLRNPNLASDDLTFDPQGRMLLIRGNDVIRMADGMTEVILRGVLGSQGGALRFLTDGSLLVADYSGDEVIRYNPPSRAALFSADTEAPMKIAVGTGNRLYVSSNDGLIYLVNTATGQEQVVASPDDEVGGLAFSPDHQTLYAGLLAEDAVVSFAVRPQGQLGPPNLVARNIPYPYAMAVDECGNIYSSGGPDGGIRRIRNGRNELLGDLNRDQLWGMGFGSGRHGWSETALYVSSNSDGQAGPVRAGARGARRAPGRGAHPGALSGGYGRGQPAAPYHGGAPSAGCYGQPRALAQISSSERTRFQIRRLSSDPISGSPLGMLLPMAMPGISGPSVALGADASARSLPRDPGSGRCRSWRCRRWPPTGPPGPRRPRWWRRRPGPSRTAPRSAARTCRSAPSLSTTATRPLPVGSRSSLIQASMVKVSRSSPSPPPTRMVVSALQPGGPARARRARLEAELLAGDRAAERGLVAEVVLEAETEAQAALLAGQLTSWAVAGGASIGRLLIDRAGVALAAASGAGDAPSGETDAIGDRCVRWRRDRRVGANGWGRGGLPARPAGPTGDRHAAAPSHPLRDARRRLAAAASRRRRALPGRSHRPTAAGEGSRSTRTWDVS